MRQEPQEQPSNEPGDDVDYVDYAASDDNASADDDMYDHACIAKSITDQSVDDHAALSIEQIAAHARSLVNDIITAAAAAVPIQPNDIINSSDGDGGHDADIAVVGVNRTIDNGDNNNNNSSSSNHSHSIVIDGGGGGHNEQQAKNPAANDDATRHSADAYEQVSSNNDHNDDNGDKNRVCRTDIDRIIADIEQEADAVANLNSGTEVLNFELQTAIDELNASITRVELETAIDDLNSTINRIECEVTSAVPATTTASCSANESANATNSDVINDDDIKLQNSSAATVTECKSTVIGDEEQSAEDLEIERLINSDKEELKRLTNVQIENLFKSPDSRDIFKQVESCYRASSASPPPVPLDTYRWEDVRRAKIKVRFNFAYFVCRVAKLVSEWRLAQLLAVTDPHFPNLHFPTRVAIHGRT